MVGFLLLGLRRCLRRVVTSDGEDSMVDEDCCVSAVVALLSSEVCFQRCCPS